MNLLNDFLSHETIRILLLTLRFAVSALAVSWVLSLLFLFFKNRPTFAFFRFLWVLPGFGYALLTLQTLKWMGVAHRYSMASVLIAWVIAGTPFLTLAIDSAIRDLDFRQKEALQTLGAGKFRSFFYFEFLRSLPAQAYALLQQFWLYLTSFSLVMILSGGFPNETLEVSIFTSVRMSQVNLTHAYALGLWQIVILIPLRLLINRVAIPVQQSEWRVHGKPTPNFLKVLALSLGAVFLLFGFAAFRGLEMDGLLPSLITSLMLAICVAGSTLVLVFALYFSRLGFLAEVGAFISPMLLTLFWWKAFAFSVLPMVNAFAVQLLLFSPWVARTLIPALNRKRVAELEAAESLGCTKTRAWFAVEWPRLRPTIDFALSLVLVLSLTEVTSVLLFAQNEFEPLSVWVQNAFMRFRMDEAILGTAILIAVSYTGMTLGRDQGQSHERNHRQGER